MLIQQKIATQQTDFQMTLLQPLEIIDKLFFLIQW